jgi:hypothetical protein
MPDLRHPQQYLNSALPVILFDTGKQAVINVSFGCERTEASRLNFSRLRDETVF